MLFSNITRRARNVPNYLRAKVKGKPFHWTMTQKQLENKSKRFETMYLKQRNKTRKSQNRRNYICNSLEKMGATNLPKYKNTYKEFCLTNENINVNEVNLEKLAKELRIGNTNFFTGNLNLPIVSPPPPPVKSEEELVTEKALQNINLSKATPLFESRANRIARLLAKSQQKENANLSLKELQNVSNWYSQRARKSKKGGKGRKTRKH